MRLPPSASPPTMDIQILLLHVRKVPLSDLSRKPRHTREEVRSGATIFVLVEPVSVDRRVQWLVSDRSHFLKDTKFEDPFRRGALNRRG
jgi:hypothetical protein